MRTKISFEQNKAECLNRRHIILKQPVKMSRELELNFKQHFGVNRTVVIVFINVSNINMLSKELLVATEVVFLKKKRKRKRKTVAWGKH